MNSNNIFAEFLLNSDPTATFDMETSDNIQSFIDFFSKPVTFSFEEGQTELLMISSTTFGVYHGQIEIIPIEKSSMQSSYSEVRNPGDMVLNDLYTDAMYYGNSPFVWCLPLTFDFFHDLQIKVNSLHMTFDCTIRAYSDGFAKLRFAWIQDPPELQKFSLCSLENK